MVWNVDPVLIHLGPVEIRYYSLMFIIGIVLGTMYVKKRFLANGFSEGHVDSIQGHIIVGMIVGARLGHCLFYEPSYYLSNPAEILYVWKGGLASHGGFAGVLIAVYVFSRKWGEKAYLWFIESILPPTVMTAGLIRIGNLMNSEILGKKSDVPWAFIFERVDSFPRHPSQIYEAVSYLSIALVLHLLWKKNVETNKWPLGKGLGLTFILTFTARFFLEFFKIEQVNFEKGMTLNMGQLLSIPFVLIGFYLLSGHIHKVPFFNFLTKPAPTKSKVKAKVNSKKKKKRK